MKPLWILFLILICAGVSQAQDASENHVPSKVTILKYNWSKEIPLPPGWDWTPFGASSSSPSGSFSSVGSDSDSFSNNTLPPVERLPFHYSYSMKIRNTGGKAITGVAWNYLFIDPGNNEKLATYQFFSYEPVAVNSSFTLRVKSRFPPTRIVSIEGLRKNKRSPYFERVEIKCVMYADGSMWKPLSAEMTDCAYLKIGQKLREMSDKLRTR